MTRSWAAWGGLALALAAAACSVVPDLRDFGYEVQFRGNDSFPEFRLSRVIEDLLIEFGRDPSTDAPIFDAAQDLRDFYLSSGFPEARVDYEIVREPELTVVFEIQEGPRVTMALPEIEGLRALSRSDLLPLWKRTQSGLLGTGDPYFVEGDLRAFAVAMRERYYAKGYLNADIEGPIIEREPGSDRAQVTYRVDEGEQFVLVEFEIAPELLRAGAPDESEQLEGQFFSTRLVQSARLRIAEALRNNGYYQPEVRLDLEIDRKSETVRARVSGTPGDRVRIAGHEISGLVRTDVDVAENEIAWEQGSWYSSEAMERTISELYRTGLFQRVEIDVHRPDPDRNEVRLKIHVVEIEAREIGILAGYGSYEKLRGAVFYTDRNFLGRGHTVRVGVEASQKSYGADVTYSEPTLLGWDTGLSATGFFAEREEPTFTDQSYGISSALSRELLENLEGRLGYVLKSRNSIQTELTSMLPDNEYVSGAALSELTFDTRDSVLFPRSGHVETIKVEYADPALLSDVQYLRLTGRATWYLPLAEDWIFGLRAETGLLWWLDDTPVPVQERFYNGGHRTVRSFEESELGPRNPVGVPLGGEFLNVFTAELRFPIFALLHGALFADAGNVGRSVQDFSLDDLSYGLGGGLRLNLPIGPVRFDAAWNPDPGPFDRDYALHFSVGFPF